MVSVNFAFVKTRFGMLYLRVKSVSSAPVTRMRNMKAKLIALVAVGLYGVVASCLAIRSMSADSTSVWSILLLVVTLGTAPFLLVAATLFGGLINAVSAGVLPEQLSIVAGAWVAFTLAGGLFVMVAAPLARWVTSSWRARARRDREGEQW